MNGKERKFADCCRLKRRHFDYVILGRIVIHGGAFAFLLLLEML